MQNILDLAPKPGNPRNSEGAFLKLRDGRLIFCWSKYSGSDFADYAPADIAAIFSDDGGDTWYGDRILFKHTQFDQADNKCKNIMSVSLMRMADGAVGLYFLVRMSSPDMALWLFRSYDEGKTFDNGVRCTGHKGYYVTNNDRVLMLKNGRIIVPANYHQTVNGNIEQASRGCVYISDDDGASFKQGGSFNMELDMDNGHGLQETGVIELDDGRLWAFSRTKVGRHYGCFSSDGGLTWTKPRPSRFTGPCSPLSIKRADCGSYVAVWNPIPYYNGQHYSPWTGGRTPLVACLSDDGLNWGHTTLVDGDAEDAGYCYTAIHFEGENLLLAYCAGGEADRHNLCRLRIKKLALSELFK